MHGRWKGLTGGLALLDFENLYFPIQSLAEKGCSLSFELAK